jgi:hypothetical protein
MCTEIMNRSTGVDYQILWLTRRAVFTPTVHFAYQHLFVCSQAFSASRWADSGVPVHWHVHLQGTDCIVPSTVGPGSVCDRSDRVPFEFRSSMVR